MKNIVIADDMPIQLHMLEEEVRKLRPKWDVFTARDGNEIVAHIENNSIDFIISDIRMPKMDGLAMLEIVRAISPNTLVVFLSGYPLFEYAQRAVQLGAVDYLIKPADELTLSDIFDRLEDISTKRMRDTSFTHIAALQQWLFTPFDQLSESETDLICKEFSFDGWVIMIYHPTDTLRFSANLQRRIMEAFDSLYNSRMFVPLTERQILIGVIGGSLPDYSKVYKKLNMLAEQEGLIFGISDHMQFPEKGFIARKQSAWALNQSFFWQSRVTQSSRFDDFAPSRIPTGEMLLHWFRLSPNECEERVSAQLLEIKRQEPWFISMLHSSVYGFAEAVEEVVHTKVREAAAQELRKVSIKMRGTRHFGNYCESYMDTVRNLSRLFEQHTQQIDLPIEKCVQYLHKHYSTQVSMEEVAHMYYLTPNYFSTLFRKKTGKRFVEYLTDLRMDKAEARIRLSNDYIYQISKECGYSDERYFNRVFRIKYGCSPAQYRKLHGRAK